MSLFCHGILHNLPRLRPLGELYASTSGSVPRVLGLPSSLVFGRGRDWRTPRTGTSSVSPFLLRRSLFTMPHFTPSSFPVSPTHHDRTYPQVLPRRQAHHHQMTTLPTRNVQGPFSSDSSLVFHAPGLRPRTPTSFTLPAPHPPRPYSRAPTTSLPGARFVTLVTLK